MANYIQVMTTVEKRSEAENIARNLLEKRLAACIQIIGPIFSYFHWQDKLDTAEEYLCLIKSREDLYQELADVITGIHPYEVPEIVAVPIIQGGKDYLNWLAAELKTE